MRRRDESGTVAWVRVEKVLERLGGVASYRELSRHVTRARLRTAVTSGAIVRNGHGSYALPTAQEALRAAAALSGVVSHASAASYWGWKSKWRPPRPCVTVPRKRKVSAARRQGVCLHYAEVTDEERQAGVTSRQRTLVDCAKTLPFDEALAVADSALRNEDVTNRELMWWARRVRTNGRRQCLRVAEEGDGRAHNPFESVLRAISLDVPGLTLAPQQVLVERPRWIQPDLVDLELRIVVEAESVEFHTDADALARDCERYNVLGSLGWTVYRFTWRHVMREPAYVRAVLTQAVRAAA
jgi:hypothetical protein